MYQFIINNNQSNHITWHKLDIQGLEDCLGYSYDSSANTCSLSGDGLLMPISETGDPRFTFPGSSIPGYTAHNITGSSTYVPPSGATIHVFKADGSTTLGSKHPGSKAPGSKAPGSRARFAYVLDSNQYGHCLHS